MKYLPDISSEIIGKKSMDISEIFDLEVLFSHCFHFVLKESRAFKPIINNYLLNIILFYVQVK